MGGTGCDGSPEGRDRQSGGEAEAQEYYAPKAEPGRRTRQSAGGPPQRSAA